MPVIKYIYCLLALIVWTSCSKQLDDHAAPNAVITGMVMDAVAKTSIQTEQPNGIKIRLIEESYAKPTPQDFWTRPDGSYENADLFSGKYKIVAAEGPFFPVDTVEVSINGTATVNFNVTPFLSISATATADGNNIILAYQLSRARVGDKIVLAKSLASAYPAVSNIVNEASVTHDLSGVTDDAALATAYSDTLRGLRSGTTWYTRVAARTANANNKFNYSTVMIVKIP
jgi:hypothetical protein